MWLIIFLLLPLQLIAAVENPNTSTLKELKRKITEIIDVNNVPAASIALVNENGPIWIDAIGKSNKKNNISANKDTLFRVGSTSKLFVGLSILKLVEQGKVQLSDKISDLIPEIKYQNQWQESAPIRVVHLLEHTTGWDDIHFSEYNYNAAQTTLKQGLDFHPHSRISRWIPGTRMSYSNSGPAVAAYIVEKIAGITYEEFVSREFFIPLHMNSSTFTFDQNMKENSATLYSGGIIEQDYRHILLRPSGALNSSANDMSNLLTFFINRGSFKTRQILSQPSLARMESIESNLAGKLGQKIGYGLTNYSKPYKQWLYRQHNGAIPGGLSSFSYLPSEKIGHSVMINSDNYAALIQISDALMQYETRNLPAKNVSAEMSIEKEHRLIEGYYYKINPRSSLFEVANLFQLYELRFSGNKLVKKSFFSDNLKEYYPVSTTLYKSADSGFTSLTKVMDPLDGLVIHSETSVLKPINTVSVVTLILAVVAWLITLLVTMLYSVYRIFAPLLTKHSASKMNLVILLPILTTYSIIATALAVLSGSMGSFSQPSISSIALTTTTTLFGIFAVLGVCSSAYYWVRSKSRSTHILFTLFSIIHFAVAIYFTYFGVIGIMTWS